MTVQIIGAVRLCRKMNTRWEAVKQENNQGDTQMGQQPRQGQTLLLLPRAVHKEGMTARRILTAKMGDNPLALRPLRTLRRRLDQSKSCLC